LKMFSISPKRFGHFFLQNFLPNKQFFSTLAPDSPTPHSGLIDLPTYFFSVNYTKIWVCRAKTHGKTSRKSTDKSNPISDWMF
jgi:hypothetical protein